MSTEKNYYAFVLRDKFASRQKNRKYSIRDYAKDLGLPSSTLALSMSGKRPVPKKMINQVINRLSLNKKETLLFKDSLDKNNKRLSNLSIHEKFENRYILDDANYKIIAEWEHYALITLMELDNFVFNLTNISKTLGISLERSEEVSQNLIQAGLIEVNSETEFKILNGPLRTTEDIKSLALQSSHLETLELGKKKLLEVDINERDFSSICIPIDKSKMKEAKNLIREFRKRMGSLFQNSPKNDVYQMAIQFYPLTSKENSHEKN